MSALRLSIIAIVLAFARRVQAEIGNPPMDTTMPQTPEQQAALAQAVGVLTVVTLAEAVVAIVDVVAEAGVAAALGNGITTAAAVGTAEGAVAGAAIGVVAVTLVLGTLLALAVIAIAVNSITNGPGSTAGAGASGEGTDTTAAANLAAAVASFPMPPSLPMVRFSVNPATGELTISNIDGIDTGQGATPNTGIPGESGPCCPGFTTSQTIGLSPAVTVTPGQSDLPAIGESVPGADTPGPDAPGLDASVSDGGAFGWVDGRCEHYATGLDCAEYREHEYGEYGERSIPAPNALVLILSIWALMMMAQRVVRR